jgi:phage shock protein C
MKKLYRIEKNKLIAGVCAGVADNFNIDVTIVRLAAVFLTVLTAWAPGIVTYLVAWYLLPDKNELSKPSEGNEV